jgi:tetratricopeptide (TPR) repeat protein
MDSVSPDARLSNYQLDRLLGAGGMGSVYLARDLALDRVVAIKFISPDKASDPAARRRLIREARAAAALDHPNICTIYEVIDDPAGQACIVMQYVEGETLAETLQRGHLDVRFALSLAADLAAALAAAHRRGIIHRDLKPQNVIVTPERRAKLLDFGIARHSDLSTISADAPTGTQLTATGALPGTPAYMSPEQVHGRPLDGRSDLFALGTVLFECLTGQRPFKGHNSLELAAEIVTHDPPPVSSLRPELTDQHDELCRRLLAKSPEDRFNSAEELLGALRVLLPDTSRGDWPHSTGAQSSAAPSRRLPGRRALVAAVSVAVVALLGVWQWNRPRLDPTGTPDALRLYELGTDWIRAGAYHSGRRALDEAVDDAPGYVPAYVRLAEACTDLDDHRGAQNALLMVDELVPDESQLSRHDRLRVQAVRALMLRKVDDAIAAYGQLVELNPKDAGALVDLGRAQDAGGMAVEARSSFEQAVKLDPRNAAAHLRLATVLSQQGDTAGALAAFTVAEDLYSAASNAEGKAEVLLRRGTFLNTIGEFPAARETINEALALAEPLQHHEQAIRARLQLSSVIASEGRFTEAQEMAEAGVEAALAQDLETVAADGLIDLATVMFYLYSQRVESGAAEIQAIHKHLEKAIALAEKREARRTVARATLQRAAVQVQYDPPDVAVATASSVLPFFRDNGYRRYELQALSIISRGHELAERYGQAREVAQEVLQIATRIQDDVQAGTALENLAGQTTAVGALPEALEFRERAEAIHRQQNDIATLAFDLPNRAELLINLGRGPEADQPLQEVEAGIAKKVEPYKPRARRTMVLRALNASVNRRYDETIRRAREILRGPQGDRDSSGQLASRLLAHAAAVRGSQRIPVSAPWLTADKVTTVSSRELRYWELAGRLASGDAKGVMEQAILTLTWPSATTSPEFEWRVAALGAAAARQVKEEEKARQLSQRARTALDRLRAAWKDDARSYEKRPDVAELIEKAGLN